MNPVWYEQAKRNHDEYVERAQKKGRFSTDEERSDFLALAIAGEAGELANLHKKSWRGVDIPQEQKEQEAADIYVYLRHYAELMGFDLDEAAAKKTAIVTERLKVAA